MFTKNSFPSSFESYLAVNEEDINLELNNIPTIPWDGFWLNPRRLRGSDFLMRWSQGVWSEHRILEAVNKSKDYFAIPYGPSGTAPHEDIREFELYFERLDRAGLGSIKRPDILIFNKSDKSKIEEIIKQLKGIRELPFTPENDRKMKELIMSAIVAVECENSLWKASQMPDYGTELTSQSRLGGKLGLKKSAVVPTVIIKEEDRRPLKDWQKLRKKEVHIWHVFYDMAFGISLKKVEKLIRNGSIAPTKQVFQAPGGATTEKVIYKIYYHHAYSLGKSKEEPKLVADSITDKNGHILPYVRFEGGTFELSPEALTTLDDINKR